MQGRWFMARVALDLGVCTVGRRKHSALVHRSARPALDDLPKGNQVMLSSGEGCGDEEVEGTSKLQNQAHPGRVQIRNWASYDRALVKRGDLTIWLSPSKQL